VSAGTPAPKSNQSKTPSSTTADSSRDEADTEPEPRTPPSSAGDTARKTDQDTHRPAGSPASGEDLVLDLPHVDRQSLIFAQLRNLAELAAVRDTGLLTPDELQAFKDSILSQEPKRHPPRETPATSAPEPIELPAYRCCPSCGHEKNRRGSNRCVACRREFATGLR
jgi:hypothetical protein